MVPGTGVSKERLQENRRQKNIVTFWYNMTIWLAETISTALVTLPTVSAEMEVFTVLLYFLVTCGVSPCLYLVGMR